MVAATFSLPFEEGNTGFAVTAVAVVATVVSFVAAVVAISMPPLPLLPPVPLRHDPKQTRNEDLKKSA